jgi:hypothetical protein
MKFSQVLFCIVAAVVCGNAAFAQQFLYSPRDSFNPPPTINESFDPVTGETTIDVTLDASQNNRSLTIRPVGFASTSPALAQAASQP